MTRPTPDCENPGWSGSPPGLLCAPTITGQCCEIKERKINVNEFVIGNQLRDDSARPTQEHSRRIDDSLNCNPV